MSTHKRIDAICLAAAVLSLVVCMLLMGGGAAVPQRAARTMGYEEALFDTTRIHTIDIVIDDWDTFLETAERETYSVCSVVIDGEAVKNVGIRGKGNTSLSSVSTMGSSRYSFKIEFDQYDSAKSYKGLDKLCLNNLIQDNTCMKDYLAYQLMYQFGVDAPLCSYAYLTVNGEDWGLYLAVEAVEESFLQRCYGSGYGSLYKPDSVSMGGGPGGGMNADDVKLQYIDDSPDSYPNIFDSAKTEVTLADKTRLIAALKQLSACENPEQVVDAEELLRYFVVHNYVVNGDSYTGSMIHNYYLYEQDGRLSMIPWDYNLAFGTFQGNSAASAVNDDIDAVLTDRPMQAWIFSDETCSQRYYALYTQLLETVDIQGIIDQAYQLIAPYVERDPTAFCTYEEFQTGVAALKEFCALRSESVRLQLSGSTEAVDTGELDLSDMGTMGGGHGNSGDRNDFPGMDFPHGEGGDTPTPPEGADMPALPDSGDAPSPTGDTQTPDGGDFPAWDDRRGDGSGVGFGDMQAFTPGDRNGQDGSVRKEAALFAASLLALAAGLGFAFRFKRR